MGEGWWEQIERITEKNKQCGKDNKIGKIPQRKSNLIPLRLNELK